MQKPNGIKDTTVYDRDSNVIEVFIGRLRKKLDPGGGSKTIETLRGRGYRFRLLDPAD